MSLVTLLIILVFIGVALYLFNTLLPIDPKIRTIINVVVILCVLLWLADVFIGFDTLQVGRVHRIR